MIKSHVLELRQAAVGAKRPFVDATPQYHGKPELLTLLN
jgi:hypothetical protein